MRTPLSMLSASVETRLLAAAEEQGVDVGQLLDRLVSRALDLPEEEVFGNGGDLLVESATAEGVLGVYFDAAQELENGELDEEAQKRDIAELESIVNASLSEGVSVRVIERVFEIGRGAQGDPVTLLQLITTIFAVIAAPAVAFNAWVAALPKIRDWLKARGGSLTLEFVKQACLEDAKTRVTNPKDLVASFVSGHRGQAFTTRMDTEAVGPYCVMVQVPERQSTFVYLTDELGQILQFLEAPGPSEDRLVAEDNQWRR